MTPATTRFLPTAFLELYEQAPERLLFTFVDDEGRDQERLTVAGLAARADAVARALPGWGVRPGDRALLVHPPSLDFVGAFLGCLAAGVLPVPVCPPDPRRAQGVAAFARLAADCEAAVVLTNGEYERARKLGTVAAVFSRQTVRWPDLPWRRTDRGLSDGPPELDWRLPGDPAAPAFLQYTSGSTSDPRGVVITHGNLAAETAANATDLGLGAGSRGVSWVPHFHDLGLISVISSTIAGNADTWLMSPLSFLRRPALWLETASRVGATSTAAPNFAFDLVVRKTTPQQRAALDLSPLRVVLSAGEPVRPGTVDGFLAAFAPAGLAPEAFYPAYGLAECTVSVTMGGRTRLRLAKQALARGEAVPVGDDAPDDAVELVGCGTVTKRDARVRIVDPTTRLPCAPGRIGEIWVDSATKAPGYYGRDAESDEVFRARVEGDDDPRSYLRTGDLGFFHDQELFVTGRHKDLMIVHGRNLYPQDVEESAQQAHELIRPGCVAAFALPARDGARDDRVVLLVEIKQGKPDADQQRDVVRAVRQRVQDDHDVVVHTVVVGRPGTVRKTTSGKVRRAACRQAFESGAVQRAATTLTVSDLRGAGEPLPTRPGQGAQR
ncbi:fatty acyl-AMP ligase [Streptomyces sp. SL13]|uniref:Fatty acyl-AMP ligase n=1 Tax=Streptantibioticus silvisoli TaxID=2705255 RepID=A0AA90H4W3_9ACTN|nr:fatty acyl-AMP ligase [Streptantibioticus silvisoli]MDI5968855.1 fatty acyl-AMP ligase [Streptantibioticus silvisoli]